MCALNAIDDYDYIYEQPDDMMMKMSTAGARAVKSTHLVQEYLHFFVKHVFMMMMILMIILI